MKKVIKNQYFQIFIGICLMVIFGSISNKCLLTKKKKTFKNAEFTIGTITDFRRQTRSSWYVYEFYWDNIKISNTTNSSINKSVGAKVLIMYYKNRPSQSFLLDRTVIPYRYLNKDTIWNEPPYFTNKEEIELLNDSAIN